MGKKPDGARRLIAPLVAVLLVGILYLLSRQPTLSREEADELASRFRFERLPLPELAGRPLDRKVRQVHPSLRHLSAFVSFSGAAVALADLDGDGLPNDLIYVDPRGDQVIVAPVPGTTERYAPFALDAAPLPFDPSTMAPTGCLAGDFNEDGLTDVLVCYWGRSPVLFLQRPEPAAGASPLARDRFVPCELSDPYQVWYTSAVTQADLDGDGHIDLIVGNYFRDGARILDAAAPGTEQMPHSASRAFNGGCNRLFLWESAGGGAKPYARFREAEGVLDDEVACGWTLAVGAADLDGDLLPEIYFVQDFGPDRLLHNRSRPGQPRFALLQGERTMTTPRSKVLGRDSFNGMGIDFGDLNGDGWPDIFVSNITGNYGLHESHFLFLSTGQVDRMRAGVAPYRDASEELGLSRSGWAWEARLADFDNDGVLEAMQAAGATKGTVNRWPELQEVALMNDQLTSDPRFWHRWQPGDDIAGADHNAFFVRCGADGRYYDIAPRIGLGEPMNSRGIATADVDGDGRLDFALANQWGPSFFFRNTAPNPGAFLGLNLRLPVGPGVPGATVVRPGRPRLEYPSRPAIGATARVYLPDGRTLVGQVDGGTGHSGKRSPELHFGLGGLDKTADLRVDLRWRGADGQVRAETVYVAPDRWHTVLLGEGPGSKTGGRP